MPWDALRRVCHAVIDSVLLEALLVTFCVSEFLFKLTRNICFLNSLLIFPDFMSLSASSCSPFPWTFLWTSTDAEHTAMTRGSCAEWEARRSRGRESVFCYGRVHRGSSAVSSGGTVISQVKWGSWEEEWSGWGRLETWKETAHSLSGCYLGSILSLAPSCLREKA